MNASVEGPYEGALVIAPGSVGWEAAILGLGPHECLAALPMTGLSAVALAAAVRKQGGHAAHGVATQAALPLQQPALHVRAGAGDDRRFDAEVDWPGPVGTMDPSMAQGPAGVQSLLLLPVDPIPPSPSSGPGYASPQRSPSSRRQRHGGVNSSSGLQLGTAVAVRGLLQLASRVPGAFGAADVHAASALAVACGAALSRLAQRARLTAARAELRAAATAAEVLKQRLELQVRVVLCARVCVCAAGW